jgi:hypothetical protein
MGAVQAGAVTIDFGPSFGAPGSNWAILTNQLAPWGVTFSTTGSDGIYWWGPGVYGSYAISEGPTWGPNPHGTDPIRMNFSVYVNQVSIRGFNGGVDTDTMTLRAYNHSNQLVASNQINSTFSTAGHTLTVAAPNIAYAIVQSNAPLSGLFFDDLVFVPEPASGLILLAGLACLVRRRACLKP